MEKRDRIVGVISNTMACFDRGCSMNSADLIIPCQRWAIPLRRLGPTLALRANIDHGDRAALMARGSPRLATSHWRRYCQ